MKNNTKRQIRSYLIKNNPVDKGNIYFLIEHLLTKKTNKDGSIDITLTELQDELNTARQSIALYIDVLETIGVLDKKYGKIKINKEWNYGTGIL